MPLRIRGTIPRGGLARQPGSKIKEKQDGSLEGLLIQEGDASARGARPRIGDPHPDDPRAICYDVDTENLKNSKIRVISAYIGVQADPTPWFQSGQGSLDKENITTHPDFISKIGGTAASRKNEAAFDPETGEFLGFPPNAGNDLAGVDSWFVPSVIFRFTRWTYQHPDFRDIGKIDIPPIPVRKPTNVRNFLAGSISYNQTGNLYQVTLELWGSGPKGWNRLVYDR